MQPNNRLQQPSA